MSVSLATPNVALAPMSVEREAVARALPACDIGGELGRGVWGIVWAGRQRESGREVAIKQLPSAFASNPDVQAGFASEGRLLASLNHPNIVPIHDLVQEDGLCLVVMERLTGGSVRGRLRSRGFTHRAAVAVAVAACGALQHAHDKDVLHRDIKPENLMFSGDDMLRVTDFGMAEIIQGTSTMETLDGDLLGTPAYMSLEQQLDEELTPATDIYALGTVLYELLAGELPRPEPASDQPRDATRPWPLAAAAPGVPAQLAAVVDRTVLDEPSERQGSARELGQELSDAASAAWGSGWDETRPLRNAIRRPFGESAVRQKGRSPQPAARAVDLLPDELVPVGAPERQGVPRWIWVAMAMAVVVPGIIAEVLRRM